MSIIVALSARSAAHQCRGGQQERLPVGALAASSIAVKYARHQYVFLRLWYADRVVK